MRKIQLAEIPFVYLTLADGFPPTRIENMPVHNHITQNKWREAIEPNLSDIRAAIWIPQQDPISIKLPMYFFHWDENIDLVDLDNRVTQNVHSVDDFDNVLLTTATVVTCLKNFDWAADVLIPEILYPDNAMKQIFETRFFERSHKERFITVCPECGEQLNQTIVKILRIKDKPQDPRI